MTDLVQCDWCAAILDEEELTPISGDEWVCSPCCNIILRDGTITRISVPRMATADPLKPGELP